MFQNILVPLDGSPFAESAIPLASRLARSARARLHLVLAHRQVPVLVGAGEMMALPGDLNEELREQEVGYLSATAERLVHSGLGMVEYHEADGLAGPELCEEAGRLYADLIVMATHGRGGMQRFWLGSVADYLIRHLSIPVLVTHPGREEDSVEDRPIRGVLVALDLSADSEAILGPVAALALATQAHVTLLHAIGSAEPRDVPALPFPMPKDPAVLGRDRQEALVLLDRIAARLRERGVSVSARVAAGEASASTLLETLQEDRYDLMALTTHGAGGVRRLLIGSVADKVMRRAAKPVLVMRPSPAA